MDRHSSLRLFLAAAVILALAAVIAAVIGFERARDSAAELGQLQTELRVERERVAADGEVLNRMRAAEEEVELLKRQNADIHRLRAVYQEHQRLQEEHARLQQELAALKAAMDKPQEAAQPAAMPAAWIGISMRPEPAGGVVIESVIPGAPASHAGLQPGDVVTAIEGQAVLQPQQLRSLIAHRSVGEMVTLDVRRGNQTFRVVITAGAFPR